MKIDLVEMRKRVAEGLVNEMENEFHDLILFNYTPICQFSKAWDEYTIMARGLIVDKEGNVVARPFDKFFNYEEVQEVDMPADIQLQEKMDGSLLILYRWKGKWNTATRGSFKSDQAQEGLRILNALDDNLAWWFSKDYTHLFEVIYPENRIVVDYGKDRNVCYLTSRENDTGRYNRLSLPNKFWQAKLYNDISPELAIEMKANDLTNQEGYVIYSGGEPYCKMKFDTYVKLHKIMTGTSAYTIWEMLRDKKDLNTILENVPDEFYKWASMVISTLEDRYHQVYVEVEETYYHVLQMATRKEQAEWVLAHCKYPGAVFFRLDGKDNELLLWKAVTPEKKDKFLQND